MTYKEIGEAIEAWRAAESKLWGGKEISIPGPHRLIRHLYSAFQKAIVDQAMLDDAVRLKVESERRRAIAEVAESLMGNRKLRKEVSEAMADAIRSLLYE
jgi:hypothetical protein